MRFKEAHPPATESAIAAFERQRAVRLPTAYRAFLLETNGGYGPELQILTVPSWPDWRQMVVTEMRGLHGEAYNSIEQKWLGNFSKGIGRQMLQFADDPSGEIFVIDLRPKTYGNVYVRCHDITPNVPFIIDDAEFDHSDYEEAELYHPVADSFEAFLTMLGPDSDNV